MPAETLKTITEAYQGFHMIHGYPDFRNFTRYITEDGMNQYRRMPLGDHVSMDAYNARLITSLRR